MAHQSVLSFFGGSPWRFTALKACAINVSPLSNKTCRAVHATHRSPCCQISQAFAAPPFPLPELSCIGRDSVSGIALATKRKCIACRTDDNVIQDALERGGVAGASIAKAWFGCVRATLFMPLELWPNCETLPGQHPPIPKPPLLLHLTSSICLDVREESLVCVADGGFRVDLVSVFWGLHVGV